MERFKRAFVWVPLKKQRLQHRIIETSSGPKISFLKSWITASISNLALKLICLSWAKSLDCHCWPQMICTTHLMKMPVHMKHCCVCNLVPLLQIQSDLNSITMSSILKLRRRCVSSSKKFLKVAITLC